MSGSAGRTILLPGQSPDGLYVLAGLVKRSYDVRADGSCVRAEEDRPLIPGDEHWGDPMNSTVRFESDFVPWKLATDVVFDGKAYAPGGAPVRQLTASLSVGAHRKEVLVLGDRRCRHRPGAAPAFSEPEPFTEMELRYERAYGGTDVRSNPSLPCIYPRNHLGRGFALENVAEAVEGLPLPNLEDPVDLLTPDRLLAGSPERWQRQPMPQSFGWFCKYWRPRAELAGVLPADRAFEKEMRQLYASALPPDQRAAYLEAQLPDMDFRFFNGASEGLALPFLRGDEEIQLVNLVREGRLAFRLPGQRPAVALDLGDGPREAEVVLHTVLVRGEERQVDLVWRGAVPYGGPDTLPTLRKLELLVA